MTYLRWLYSSHAKKAREQKKCLDYTSNMSFLTIDSQIMSSQTKTLALLHNGSQTFAPNWKLQRTQAWHTISKQMDNWSAPIKPLKPFFTYTVITNRTIGCNIYP
jgi:hypothetical protein